MPSKKKPDDKSAAPSHEANVKAPGVVTSARSTVGAPAGNQEGFPNGDALADRLIGIDTLAAALQFNPNKASEYGEASREPQPGVVAKVDDVRLSASTLTEVVPSNKTGSGQPNLGLNPGNLPVDSMEPSY